MSRYRIFETNHFQSQLGSAKSAVSTRFIRKKLDDYIYPQLRDEPHFGPNIKKLQDYTPESWRFRIGDFRVFYSIDEKTKVVVMTAIRQRKDAYR